MKSKLIIVNTYLSPILFICFIIIAYQSHAFAQATSDNMVNLAKGKQVWITPTPHPNQQVPSLLTDGKITPKVMYIGKFDNKIEWRYSGRVNIAIDLGQQCYINKIALRMGGGQGATRWIQAVASQDGKHWVTVGEVSRFEKNHIKKFKKLTNTPVNKKGIFRSGKVFTFSFKNLDIDARWVGIRMQTNGPHSCRTDEFYAYGNNLPGGSSIRPIKGKPAAFSVKHPQIYFNKPRLKLITNIATPLPIGVTPPARRVRKNNFRKPLTFSLELPPGIQLLSGHFGQPFKSDTPTVKNARVTTLKDGWKKYTFTDKHPPMKFGHFSNYEYGRLYLQATGWNNGQKGELRYSFGQGNWHSKTAIVPIEAITMKKAPHLKTIITGLGWWRLRFSVRWPNVLKAFRQIGLNTFPVMRDGFLRQSSKSPGWKLINKARKKGFYISLVSSPVNYMFKQFGKDHPQIYHQGKNGPITHGRHVDPSYRGKYYHKTIQHFAKMIAKLKPDFTSQDVETFHFVPLKTYKECRRCQRLFAASKYNSWDKWRLSLGDQMWHDFIGSARKALEKEGANPYFKSGMYALRPGVIYDHISSFDNLYPKYFTSSQPSRYGNYSAGRLRQLGKWVRQDRQKLPKSDVIPWITPGDAGTFPGRVFRWALLECYSNGARGIWFWSGNMWDAEDLLAYNKIIRAIAPVESVIVKGNLVGDDVKVVGKGHVSGVKHNNKMMLFVEDFLGQTNKISLDIKTSVDCEIIDLFSHKIISKLPAGINHFVVDLQGKRARLLSVVPIKN